MPTSNKTTYIRNGQPVNTDAYPLNKMVTWPGIKKYHEMLAYEIPRLGSNNRIGAIALYSFSLGQSNMVTGASVASFALGSGNTVIGSYSFIAGYGNTITGSSVTAFGRNLTLDATQNNERPLLMIGDGLNISDEAWKGKQVAFAIGGKEKDKDAKNLIIVTYDGKTVINGDLTVTGTLSNTGEGATIEGKADRTRNWLIGMKQAYLTNNDMGQHALWSIANEGLTKDDKSLDNHLLINYNHPDLTQAPKVIAFHRGPDEYADIYCKDCECAGLVGIKSGVIYSGKGVIQFRTGPASDAGYSDLYCKDVECSGMIGVEQGVIYNSNGKIRFQTRPGNTTAIKLECGELVATGLIKSGDEVQAPVGRFNSLYSLSHIALNGVTGEVKAKTFTASSKITTPSLTVNGTLEAAKISATVETVYKYIIGGSSHVQCYYDGLPSGLYEVGLVINNGVFPKFALVVSIDHDNLELRTPNAGRVNAKLTYFYSGGSYNGTSNVSPTTSYWQLACTVPSKVGPQYDFLLSVLPSGTDTPYTDLNTQTETKEYDFKIDYVKLLVPYFKKER